MTGLAFELISCLNTSFSKSRVLRPYFCIQFFISSFEICSGEVYLYVVFVMHLLVSG